MAFSTKNKKSVTYVTEERFKSEIKNINNAIVSKSHIKECTISKPRSIQFSSYLNLENAKLDLDSRHLGELVYIESDKNLYQVSEDVNGLFYDKLVKSSEFDLFVTAKCTDVSGQAFYNNKEDKVLFSDVELDNKNIVNIDDSEIVIKDSGIYSINTNLVIKLVKNSDIVKKFGFYKNDKFVDITSYFLKSEGNGYLSGHFEGYLEKGTKLNLVLELKCTDFLYLSHKLGVNFISLRSLRLGNLDD